MPTLKKLHLIFLYFEYADFKNHFVSTLNRVLVSDFTEIWTLDILPGFEEVSF